MLGCIEEVMADIQYNYSSSIGGIPLWNLKFADDIYLLAGTNNELQELTNLLANSATRKVVWRLVSKKMR